MVHFLVIFDRRHRNGTTVERIEDGEAAVARLFEIEEDLRGDLDRGVVMLVAESEDTIRATHAHYFTTLDELLRLAESGAATEELPA